VGFRASSLALGAGWLAALVALSALAAQGVLLGAAFSCLMRVLVVVTDAEEPAAGSGLGTGWSAQAGGWALGAATGALVARHVGTQALLLLAALAVLVAAVTAGRPRALSADA
jgi:predicted MFS family arabinose efflux permease